MPDYTKKHVSELKDSAPGFGFGEIAEARFPAEELDAEQTGFAHHRLKPGKRQGFGHHHDEAEEVCFIVSGSGRVKLDDDLVELQQGDFLRVAPPVKRRFEAGPEGLEYVVFGASFEQDGDLDHEFWAPEE
jgi:mannose-6-phosphate isomerase-like protein (cupin superfamily)